jgi:site-specific DNA-methyltransferase (adenine-specific)
MDSDKWLDNANSIQRTLALEDTSAAAEENVAPDTHSLEETKSSTSESLRLVSPKNQRMKGPFFTTSHGVLYDTDCLQVLANMKSGVIDTVFADPPFNIGKDYKNGFNDRVAKAEYLTWCRTWIEECCRIIKPGGAFFLYATPELAVQFAPIMGERLDFRHWIALTMKGTFPRGQKLYPAHYALLYYTRGAPRVFNKLRLPIETCRHCGKEVRDYGGHRDKMNPAGVNLMDFWTDTSPNRHKKFKVRPGVNELKLVIPERAILISTEPGDLVFDPFGGGGSTFQAAENHHRNWIGTELFDSRYIQRRIEEAFPVSAAQQPRFAYKKLFNEDQPDQVLRRFKGQGLPPRTGTHLS